VLPWPPSVNRIWRAILGRVVLSESARNYVPKLINKLPTGPVDPLRGRLFVTMLMRPPLKLKNRAMDIANREKLVCDCLTKQRVWLDDSQIDMMLIARGAPCDEGCVEMLIQEMPE
jgi:crossover junction endodeoxyribonuclease RusA